MSRMGYSLRISVIAGISGLFVFATTASAGVVTVVNASFEDPVVSGPSWITDTATGWQTNPGQSGVLNPTAGGFGGAAPDGIQVGWTLGNASLIQDVGAVIAAGQTYTLSVDVGARSDGVAFGNYQLILGYGGHDLATTTIFGFIDTPVTPAAGTYALASVSGLAPAGTSGLHLLIFLDGNTIVTGQAGSDLFDKVSLTASSVPEPGSLTLLLGLGLASFGGTAWLKRRNTKIVCA